MSNVRQMRSEDAAVVAQIHAETITRGFLTKLGRRFLRQLYLGIATDTLSCVFVATKGEQLAGFCAFSQDVGTMYRHVLRSRWLLLAVASLPASLSPWVIYDVFDTLRYPTKQARLPLPSAEILSIGVSPHVQGAGIGQQVLEAALAWGKQHGTAEVKVLAGAQLETANRFYERRGFTQVTKITQHGEALNVYVRRL